MEYGWTKDQVKFRERVRAAVDELLPPDWDEVFVPQSYASDAQVEFSRTFCANLAERGLLVPHWPKQYGGNDADDWQHFILGEEMKAAGEPRGPQYMNVNWIGPAIMRYGSEAQRREHLLGDRIDSAGRRLLRGIPLRRESAEQVAQPAGAAVPPRDHPPGGAVEPEAIGGRRRDVG